MDFRAAIAAAIAAAILFGAMVAVRVAGVGGLGCCPAALACNGVAPPKPGSSPEPAS